MAVKIDLHCHLDGSLPLYAVRGLAAEQGVSVPGNEQELLSLLQAGEQCDNLKEYLERFELPLKCLASEWAFEEAVYAVLEDASRENVKYLELRFAPLLSVSDELGGRNIVEACIRGCRRAEITLGIRGNLILCGMRHMPAAENIKVVKLARELLGAGVCAIDLAGDETAYPVSLHSQMFEQARRWQVPITIHAGECGSAESVRQAVALGADRIGHGIAMRHDRSLMEEVRKRKIGIEMCPVSNRQTKAVLSMEEYPFADFLAKQILVTVNTDNRTVSNTTIEREYELLSEHFEMNDEIGRRLTLNAVEMAFADDDTKHWLLTMDEK